MWTKLTGFAFVLMLLAAAAQAQEKPALVVHVFTVVSGVQFPYDMKQLQAQTIVQLKIKEGDRFNIAGDPPEKETRVYALKGEVLEWHAGKRATRLIVGMGAGRETAKIHYWLVDGTGEKVFEHTDTIRQSVWGGGYVGSVGQLAEPFADKIAKRLTEAKLAPMTTSTAVTKESEAQSGPQARAKVEAEKPAAEVGIILVSSVPDGAEVYIDGNFVGGTPATLKLAPGKHTIRVALKDYKDWSRELSLLASSEVKLTATLEKQN